MLAEEDEGSAWLAFDVLEVGEGLVVARRGVAVRAVLAEAHIGIGARVRRRVVG